MWEERARRTRRDIAALAASGVGVNDLHAAAIELTARDVGTDLTCWATIDPQSLVISAMVSGETRLPAEYEPLLADAEYSGEELDTFAGMARSRKPLARLSDLPLHDQERSARYRNVWKPLGVRQELRVLFSADGSCWGAAGMVRAGTDFSEREVEYLTAVAPSIAAATRLAVRSELSAHAWGSRPAIVVLSSAGDVCSATPEARHWQEHLDEFAPHRFDTMMHIMVQGLRSNSADGFRATLRDGHGQWAHMEASPLTGEDDGQIAVVITPATGAQLTGMLLAAYGLSARERAICLEVMAGSPTRHIARHLSVTPNTVQDHLKSVFAKTGVTSRGELVARLQPR
ncbi:helix-turn-helix transcriptional regulator [Arthrobacter sp. JZ12]|uniref:helix-turn-helix transcriptional regulator n=1 Tax=Arthrobacter sp. JZ12 TaxID=2654190 RepID=UPI002B470D74|nr:helix-turn-helix transcriptional regulator [Arthrobacter sp. JZ12]WRH24486.1 helix-turn-helix transcriptional regulator [Arthrobacter sp. JZ12]